MAKLTKEEIIASLKEMSVLELNELVKAVEEEFGVTAAAPVAAAAAPAEEGPVNAGPTEVTLFLKGLGKPKVTRRPSSTLAPKSKSNKFDFINVLQPVLMDAFHGGGVFAS